MNICVIMFYDDNIKFYGDINYKINKLYCDKYNLKIILSREKKYSNRHSAWERLPLMLDNITKFEKNNAFKQNVHSLIKKKTYAHSFNRILFFFLKNAILNPN